MRTLLVGVALFVSACTPESRQHDDSTVVVQTTSATTMSAPAYASAVPSAADAAKDPTAAFTRYLAYARFRGAPSGTDSLSACPPFDESGSGVQEGWEPDNYVGLMRPRVLAVAPDPADTTGRTATAHAEVIRVAEIGRDSLGWMGTLGRRVDTLTFTVERGATGWAVCGPATSVPHDSMPGDMAFVITYEEALRTEVNNARWLPDGTSWQSVAAHADSLVKAPL
jgi:hypothetical protein